MSDATKYRQWRVPRALFSERFAEIEKLMKEKGTESFYMDTKTTPTPLFKEEHVEKTVKPKAVSPERAKFVELAQKRMNRAIKAIRAVGQLERRKGELIAADVMAIDEKLLNELEIVNERLTAAVIGEPDFRLRGEVEDE